MQKVVFGFHYNLNTLFDFMANVADYGNDATQSMTRYLNVSLHDDKGSSLYQKSSPWRALDVLIIFRHLNTPLDTFLITIQYNFTL